jgi:hypothetical protein
MAQQPTDENRIAGRRFPHRFADSHDVADKTTSQRLLRRAV